MCCARKQIARQGLTLNSSGASSAASSSARAASPAAATRLPNSFSSFSSPYSAMVCLDSTCKPCNHADAAEAMQARCCWSCTPLRQMQDAHSSLTRRADDHQAKHWLLPADSGAQPRGCHPSRQGKLGLLCKLWACLGSLIKHGGPVAAGICCDTARQLPLGVPTGQLHVDGADLGQQLQRVPVVLLGVVDLQLLPARPCMQGCSARCRLPRLECSLAPASKPGRGELCISRLPPPAASPAGCSTGLIVELCCAGASQRPGAAVVGPLRRPAPVGTCSSRQPANLPACWQLQVAACQVRGPAGPGAAPVRCSRK